MSDSNRIALIADDDEFFRVALRSVLIKEFLFHEVIEVDSLDDALEQLDKSNDFTIALFDLFMPGMQSPANLRAVRACFPKLTVGIVSASTNRRDILLALEAGVHGYIPKGIGVRALTSALRTILEGAIYVPPCIASFEMDAEVASAQSGDKSLDAVCVQALTSRQSEVLEFLVEGKSNKEIARKLHLAEGTVKVHMAALFRGLGVTSRSAAAVAGAKLLSRR